MLKRSIKAQEILALKEKEINATIEFIKLADFDDYEYDQNIDLIDGVYFHKIKYNLKEKRDFKLENHHDMIDVHFSLKGDEKIYIAQTNDLNLEKTYNADIDIEWYSPKENSIVNEIIIKENEYLIVVPSEAHEPDNIVNDIEHEKVIFKIKI